MLTYADVCHRIKAKCEEAESKDEKMTYADVC
jgi:hypothetical protein